MNSVVDVYRVTDRIMGCDVECCQSAYPTGWMSEEKEQLCSELAEIMESVPRGEREVIGADFSGSMERMWLRC